MITVYQPRLTETILGHGLWHGLQLHDIDDDPRNLTINALAASGDCFETLASDLDTISISLPEGSAEQFQIEQIIRTLLYLQCNYRIVKKHPTN